MDVQSVDDAWNVTQNRQEDVDEKVSAAATLKEYTKWWEQDGEDDLDDVAILSVSTFLRVYRSAAAPARFRMRQKLRC